MATNQPKILLNEQEESRRNSEKQTEQERKSNKEAVKEKIYKKGQETEAEPEENNTK